MSSTSMLAAHVRAAEPELAGRAQHVAERLAASARGTSGRRTVGRRQRAPVPQLDAERTLGKRRARARSRSGTVTRVALTRLKRRELGGLPLRAHAHDVPGQPESSRAPRSPARRGRAPSGCSPCSGGGRERVVVVVPRLAERDRRRQPREVARLVAGVEALAPEEVAQRVDAVGRRGAATSIRTAPPHSSAGQAVAQRAADQPAEPERRRRSPPNTHSRNVRSTQLTTGSASRSGA